MRLFSCLLILIVALSCKEPKPSDSNLFSLGVSLGTVDERLLEASGIVESISYPKHLWTLNDSGNLAEVFLIDEKAQTKLVCKLKDIENRDFEDIAVGVGPDSTKNYIYVGDIGDNLARYHVKYIYRFEEPVLRSEKEIEISMFDTLQIQLPDGTRDSETMMIDPVSNDLYLVSKMEDSVHVYRIQYPFKKEIMKAEKICAIPFYKITSGSISADGKEVLLKDYDNIYYWNNEGKISLEKLLQGKPKILPYTREKQGEAITWARDGSGYYTLSEKADGKLGGLLFYKRNYDCLDIKS